MPFALLTQVGPKKRMLDGGQDWKNPFTAMRSEKSMILPSAKLLWTFVTVWMLFLSSDEQCQRTEGNVKVHQRKSAADLILS